MDFFSATIRHCPCRGPQNKHPSHLTLCGGASFVCEGGVSRHIGSSGKDAHNDLDAGCRQVIFDAIDGEAAFVTLTMPKQQMPDVSSEQFHKWVTFSPAL